MPFSPVRAKGDRAIDRALQLDDLLLFKAYQGRARGYLRTAPEHFEQRSRSLHRCVHGRGGISPFRVRPRPVFFMQLGQ